MNTIQISENITQLRKKKQITQEALADYLGVTKASVSKWETGQCMPDLLLIPQLAAFFDVSIDTLIGYEPQLSPEQIRKLYVSYTADFASKPFDDVYKRVKSTAKRYYSCYPLLFHLAVLYLNHCNLAGSAERSKEILREAEVLCERIINDCRNPDVVNDAISLKASLNLVLGNAAEVIETLQPITSPTRLSTQNDSLLIQAYCISGLKKEAIDLSQISVYLHLLSMITISTQYLCNNTEEHDNCLETIHRIDSVIETYDFNRLHPNIASQYHYQAALNYIAYGDNDNAVKRLDTYIRVALSLCGDGCTLHGDKYFNRLDRWIEKLTLGANPPRDKSFIRQSIRASLSHPAFVVLADSDAFRRIIKISELED